MLNYGKERLIKNGSIGPVGRLFELLPTGLVCHEFVIIPAGAILQIGVAGFFFVVVLMEFC